jgi:plasmid stability protein
VRCPALVPGPAWLLVRRDGEQPPYSYGTLEASTPTTRVKKRFTPACPGWPAVCAAPRCRCARLYPVRIGETSRRRTRLVMRLLLRADRPAGWKVFASSGGFRLSVGSVPSPDASLLRLMLWQALSAEKRGLCTRCPYLVTARPPRSDLYCYNNSRAGETMAQLLVRNLDLAVREALRRRAQRHGRSMEEEVRLILRQAVEAGEEPAAIGGLGRRIASLFAAAELEQPIREWQGEEAAPAALDS